MTHVSPAPFQIQAHLPSLTGPFRAVDDEEIPQHIQKIPQLVQHKEKHDVRGKLAPVSLFSPSLARWQGSKTPLPEPVKSGRSRSHRFNGSGPRLQHRPWGRLLEGQQDDLPLEPTPFTSGRSKVRTRNQTTVRSGQVEPGGTLLGGTQTATRRP